MSKSVGNVIAPDEVAKKYGTEILRLWVGLSDYSSDLKISDGILKQVSEQYRKVRNTIRFLLANVSDLKEVETRNFTTLDKWILNRASIAFKEASKAFKECDFSKGFNSLLNFLSADLSGIYLDVCKDRLYCDDLNESRRISAQSVMVIILRELLPLIAPTLTYTVDEVMEYAPKIVKDGAKDAFDLVYKGLEFDYESDLENKIFMSSREKFFESIDALKKEKIIKSTLELVLETTSTEILSHDMDEIMDWFMVSDVRSVSDSESLAEFIVDDELFRLVRTDRFKCPRCWSYQANKEGDVCPRCMKVLNA